MMRITSVHGESRRGFYLISLLIVLAIIAILVGNQMGGGDEEKSTAKVSIKRANTSACVANRNVAKTAIAAWRVTHSAEPLTVENIRKTNMNFPGCPDGGVYEIGADGEVYCSKHAPRPENVPLAGKR